MINDCNQNSMDPLCGCSQTPVRGYKIFNTKTSQYACCGNIGFQLTQQNYPALSAGLADYPGCLAWWQGSAGNFPTQPDQLTPGVDFYFPDWDLPKPLPEVWGPTPDQLTYANIQMQLSNIFDSPNNAIQGTGSIVTCPQKGQNLYWLKYQNPNIGGSNFAFTMVCGPPVSNIKKESIYNVGNWSLFNVNCDNPGYSGDNLSSCSQNHGQLMAEVIPQTIGSQVLASINYTSQSTNTKPTSKSGVPLWVLIIIVIVVVVALLILALIFYFRNRSG